MRFVCVALLLVSLPGLAGAEEHPLNALCARYSGFDLNADGRVEIESLRPLEAPAGEAGKPLVVVLVEERLLEPLDGEKSDLLPSLVQYRDDLARDGWRAMLVAARVYSGTVHQDGRTLLAMRRFFQDLRAAEPGLAGTVLVGSFPEAMLVRSCNWVRRESARVHAGTEEVRFERIPQIRTMAELVAARCELVLCDLDGNWEETYVEPRTNVPWLLAVYSDGVPSGGGPTPYYELGHNRFEDFFFVNDGRYTTGEVKNETGEILLDVRLVAEGQNAECATSDLELPNPMSQPDILVSRLNAKCVAYSPRAGIRGASGEGLLDENGIPQRVQFKDRDSVPQNAYGFDAALERQLLVEYFARNHRYRLGEYSEQDRPAAVSHGLWNGMREVRRGMREWRDAGDASTVVADANLAQYAEWLRQPAVFRDVRAHSFPWGTQFGRCDAASLEAVAGPAWCWRASRNALVPTLSSYARRGNADFYLYRTLWGNGRMPDTACLYFHTGCDSISPGFAEQRAYNSSGYGRLQGAESLLFYANGLALVGRAKTFYDWPRGFHSALSRGETFGEAWRGYFTAESRARSAREVGGDIGRKRAYFWSVLGDWTLRLRPAPEAAG